jgi:large subunit ribosomal protein L24
MKFRIGDEVQVTAGKDKGKRGKIERVFQDRSSLLVGGVNLYKKHVRGSADRTKTGGIVDIARPLPSASVALICKNCTKPTRIGYKILDGKKIRICRKCEGEL